MNATRVAVIGAAGRMGGILTGLVREAEDLELAAAVTQAGDPSIGKPVFPGQDTDATVSFTSECPTEVDVLVEFTDAVGVARWAEWAAAERRPLVSGSTGLDEAQQAALRDAGRKVPVVWAPNMSVGVNLLLQLVAQVAETLGRDWNIEIVEQHHNKKLDAPSGTAAALAATAARARARIGPRPALVHGREGRPGARPIDEIGVHALRMGSVVGDHQVHFSTEGETVSLSHHALDRAIFCRGALRAARWVTSQRPGLYSMRDVLENR